MDYKFIAKLAAHFTVAGYVAKLTSNLVARNTDIDPEGMPLKVGSLVVGEVVANQADPYTDELVETAFEKFYAWKARRNATNQ